MTGLRYSPLHVTEFCGEMQGKFKVGCARLINLHLIHISQNAIVEDFNCYQYHLSLFVVIKIMKQNNKSTDFDCSCSSD